VIVTGSYEEHERKVLVKASTEVEGEDTFGDCLASALAQCKVLFQSDLDETFDPPVILVNRVWGTKDWIDLRVHLVGDFTVSVTTKRKN
jgi:hypothetical protein